MSNRLKNFNSSRDELRKPFVLLFYFAHKNVLMSIIYYPIEIEIEVNPAVYTIGYTYSKTNNETLINSPSKIR